MRARALSASLAFGVGAGVLAACGSPADQPGPGAAGSSADQRAGCIADYQPGHDYFPHKNTIEYATNFTIRYEKTYQVLTVPEPTPGGKPKSYVLVRCGAPQPKLDGELADAPRLTVPIASMYAGSNTNLPSLVDLGQLDVLRGVPEAKRVHTKEVRTRIEAGKVTEFAPGGKIDVEKVVAANPDVVTTGGTTGPAHRKLRRTGIVVIPTGDWRETTPLGRAEWIKVIAALTGTQQRAKEVFDGIEQRYRQVAAKADKAEEPTPVLAGLMFQGKWYVPPGESYRTKLIRDAGGTHPWEDVDKRGVLTLGFEEVLVKAADAEVWISSVPWRTLEQGRRDDPRYAEFAAFSKEQVWTHVPPGGGERGSDYWERGVTHPDLVLADYVAMLHPELMPDHEFAFFRRVPKS